MNIMRKFLSTGSSQGSVTSPTGGAEGQEGDEGALSIASGSGEGSGVVPTLLSGSGGSSSQRRPPSVPNPDLLGLTHLKRLFSDYQNPPHPLNEQEKEARMYQMLPLFCKVFGSVPSRTACERFGGLEQMTAFAHATSRLLVVEVRRRASNQSTEEAAEAIADYMEVVTNPLAGLEEASNEPSDDNGLLAKTSGSGWILLSALNVMSADGDGLNEVLTTASVPSTLVKCLYLFFDLPPIKSTEVTKPTEDVDTPKTELDQGTKKEDEKEFTAKERRILLQKMLIELLQRLCGYVPAVEELARKDDLTLLFSAVSSVCPHHNVMWRKTAADILLTISTKSLSQPVISYLHNKGCIALCMENMQRSTDLTPLEIVEMFVTVFCFLKDSASNSQTLLEDFRTCQGYVFLSEFLLKLDQCSESDTTDAVRNLVLLVASLSFCGHTELTLNPIAANASLYELESFQMPEPDNKGSSTDLIECHDPEGQKAENLTSIVGSTVRNIPAFQVLQSVFLKAQSAQMTTTILGAINTIFSADSANYFLVEHLHPLSQFAEKIHLKPTQAQEKFFQLVEFVVHQLRFVPCKELISISLLLNKAHNHDSACSILALRSLRSILKVDMTFKDVFREVGMVEVLISLLDAYAAFLRPSSDTTNDDQNQASQNTGRELDPSMMTMGDLSITVLSEILAGSNANAGVFRESGGAKITLDLVKIEESRDSALSLMQQLVLACSGSSSGNGDEDMTSLLELLHTSAKTELELKADILHTIISCLRESHRTRAVFRRVGGFVYVISVLVSLESSLSKQSNKFPDERSVFVVLRAMFTCLTVAMRYEPANAKYFQVEMNCGSSVVETIKLLGCFSPESELKPEMYQRPNPDFHNMFHQIFTSDIGEFHQLKFKHDIPKDLFSCCVLLRMMYDMAVDNYDKSKRSNSTSINPNLPSQINNGEDNYPSPSRSLDTTRSMRKKIPTLNLTPIPPDPVIVHAGIVTTMLKILPSLYFPEHEAMSVCLMVYTAETIKSLLRTEKNQQIMSGCHFLSDILTNCQVALEDDAHILHSPFQYLLERLSAQYLEPKDLRDFLRLDNPLRCLNDEDIMRLSADDENLRNPGRFIPLTRIKTLVSMTTPRDIHTQTNSILPPFVEFDMAPEGFGCLYLPSVSPCSSPHMSSASSSVVSGVGHHLSSTSQEGTIIGGIGLGDRAFPPQPGLTFATWVCIDKYSDPRSDPHPVRLLTLGRRIKGGIGSAKDDDENNQVCLSICLSARDKALMISTQEASLNKSMDWQPEFSGDRGCRIWFPDLIKEGEWHHIVVVLNRQVLKNSSFSLYVNGQHIASQKMQYINPFPGGITAANSTMFNSCSVFAFIGTPPHWRRHSRLNWKQGPCILYEDVTSANLALLLFKLGPHYLGSLQAPQVATTGEVLTSQVNEERIIFGLNAVAMSQMTLAKIKKIYSKVDNKAIAKQLGMSSNENATPIRIIHNSAGHLLGPARSLGGVIIGYLGVRVFTPQPVSKVIETVGGCHVLLGIIAMARDMESLYAGVKALVCVLKSNPFSRLQMEKVRGYQTLAMLLRKKIPMLNSHILYLMFTMAGTIDSSDSRDVTGIPNIPAFRDVLCDLDVWHEAPQDLEKALFEHFYELIADTSMQRNGSNIRTLREFCLVEKLLAILKTSECSNGTTLVLLNVIHSLLCSNPRVTDVLCFALFTAATLNPTTNIEEKSVTLVSDGTEYSDNEDETPDLAKVIILRNRCLKLFFSLLYTGNKIHHKYCEDVVQVVGFDWVQLFLQGHLHSTTVIWGLRILMTLLSIPSLLEKFRCGTCNGHWLIKSEVVLQNKMVQALGQNSTTSSKVTRRGIRQDIFKLPGFQLFNWLMPNHIEIPETYFLIIAMVLGQPVKNLPKAVQFDLESVWNYVFGTSATESSYSDIADKINLSADAMITILCMVRTMLNCETEHREKLPNWLKEYPVTLTQFLFYLYHNVVDFMPAFMTEEVLAALAGTLFPTLSENSSAKLAQQTSSSPSKTPVKGLAETKESADETDTDGSLPMMTSHPAKRNVMNFMRVLIVDSLSLEVPQKKSPVIDLLLDAQPENILIGDQAAMPIVPGGNIQNVAPNVFYLASRLVDKLWQGIFKKEPDEVFQFILKLISQAKRRSGAGSLSLEGIYRCLNRTILYMISRPHNHADVSGQIGVLEVLHKITTHRSIVFGAGNHELEYFGCLTFCLLQLTAGLNIPIDPENRTHWHVNPTEDPLKPDDLESESGVNAHQGKQLLINAANRVWEEMFVCKRPALEEAFKSCSFGTQNSTPPLESLRDQLWESATKTWHNYVSLERKAQYSRYQAWEFHAQLESRIQRITGGFAGGLKRLTSVTGGGNSNNKPKKEEPTKVEYSNLPKAIVDQATLSHIIIVRDVVEQHYKNRLQTGQHMLKYVEEEWLQTEATLTQERGLWGPYNESRLTKWSLDMTEGPSRMRKRMIRNDMFYLHYPHREYPEQDENKPHKYKKPTSFDSKLWHEQHHRLTMFERECEQIVEMEFDDCDVTVQDKTLTIDEQIKKIGFQGLKSAIDQATVVKSGDDETNNPDEDPDGEMLDADEPASSPLPTRPMSTSSIDSTLGPSQLEAPTSPPATSPSPPNTSAPVVEEDSSDYQTVMRLLEEGEKITHMYRCSRIQGLDTAEGLLLFGKEHFYILDGFTLVNGREVHDIEFIPPNRFEPIIPVVPGQVSKFKTKRQVNKFAYDGIKEVQKRRYLLQPIAVEVFSSDGRNFLLAFIKQIRSKVYQRFLALATSISDHAHLSVAGQKRSANVEQGSGLLSTLMGETSVTQRWIRGEISNFQYIMALNTLAGRSYNDLMQYPVFPWVVADYSSEELDLSNPATFRDLSKPMGAQTASRLEQFNRRYHEWDDPHSDTPPYHYGTHYSSAMIVSSYLVRLEPFAQHFLHLQGGHFDLADRMFHSVEEAWESASKNNMADLRELIPEFFYLPGFLENANNFDLGQKQNGEKLKHVVLPPWAKDSPAEFIRVHREALESDYVSAHLHEWIDLIFGYKQQGQPAIEAVNVFHHLFYEGNVDIFSIEDPLQRNATIGFINNFGQIPKNLFKKPHPAKKVLLDNAPGIHMNSKVFFHHLTNLRPSMSPIKELKGPVGQIQCVDRLIYAVEQNKVLVPGNSNRYLAWGYADQSFRLGNYESDKAVFICEPNYLIGQVLTCVCPNSKVVLTAGTSSVVAVYEYHKKVKQLLIKTMLYGHTDAVTCLAASPSWNIAVSGSRDRTAIIWDLSRYCYVKHLSGHCGPIAAVTINELTGEIVTCAGSWIYLWDINGRLQASVNMAASSPSSHMSQQILCVCCSQFSEWDRENVIMTGSSDGVVRMWSVDYIEIPVGEKSKTPPEDLSAKADDEPSEASVSIANFAKKMSMSLSGDCLSSLREAIAQTKHSEQSEPSSDTEEGDDLETEDDLEDESSPKPPTDSQAQQGSSIPCIPVNEGNPIQSDHSPTASGSQRLQEANRQPNPGIFVTNEDFVVVNETDLDNSADPAAGAKHNSDGYTWSRRLVFRAKLTMHTAFERPDNVDPASVTALAVSKDHRSIYVGDDKGRVFSWSVSSKPGKGMVDHWCKDEGSESCVGCGVKFTIYERRHHCRACGKLFCSSCSQYQASIPKMKILQKVRVCKPCFDQLKASPNQ
eukprot:TCALIF_05026-PB protein Name:"Similar to WDFY3 WD repeat and FYVE domain-containing protein 3 (Homo sapiens)" AED:0.04 eAED:0.04 QI:7/0.93/0.68/1/1/1/16/134/3650